jgi:GWxTD domain-containing protein
LETKAIEAVVMRTIFYAPRENETLQLQPYIEAYWQVDPKTIAYKKENEEWKGKIRTDIVISNASGIVNQEHYILETLPVPERDQVTGQRIIDLRRFELPGGTFKLEIKLQDLLKPGNEFIYSDSFLVDANNRTPRISDIQLVDTSFKSSERTMFHRNNKMQVPLCTNFLDDTRKTLKYYAEIYDTHTLSNDQLPLIRKVFISRKENELAYNSIIKVDTIAPALLAISEGSLPVVTLASGNYYLNILLEDKSRNQIALKSLFFQLLNSKPEEVANAATTGDSTKAAPIYLDLNKTFLAKYSFAQVRAILKMILPIAEPNEKNRINDFISTPDEMYSRYFVYNFWLTRNKLNPEREWKEYSERVKEVNKLFGSSMLPGYETERGTIYLKYGKPSERIKVENEQGSLPYELWRYDVLPKLTNAVLLFYRPGFISNDYKLLHSTIPGERRNRNWRMELYSSGGATQMNGSRAEQLIGNR